MRQFDSINFLLKFALVFYSLMLLGTLTSCSITDDDLILPQPTLELDGRLPIDLNGFYHLELNDSSNQTIHTISGTVGNTLYWDEPMKVEWESNLYWEYEGEDVNTSNQASYVVDGMVYNVIAPINTMVGDTLILTGIIREHLVSKTIKFVLD